MSAEKKSEKKNVINDENHEKRGNRKYVTSSN